MDAKNKIDVSAAHMVDFKAELFRKKEEFNQQRLSGHSKKPTKKQLPILKQNPGVAARAEKDLVREREEEQTWEKSRRALEQKAKLYDEMSKKRLFPGESEENGDSLVDFEKKILDNIRQEKEEYKANGDEEEWVDYEDAFGRTRTCMKKDLPQLMQHDEGLKKDMDKEKDEKEGEDLEEKDLMSDDMRREVERQQWEKEEMEAVHIPQGPVHYESVRQEEIRSHGVGYYAFSTDETKRQEELERLQQLTKATEKSRQRADQVKQKRKANLEARLAKVKQRRMIGGDEEVVEKKAEEVVDDISEKLRSLREEAEKSEVAEMKSSLPRREWDKGKSMMPASMYVEKEREKRRDEFAPPRFYND